MRCTACGVELPASATGIVEPQRTKGRRILVGVAWTAAVCVAAVMGFLALPTLMVLATGGFGPREELTSVSPDGRYRVTVTRQVDFPANEWLDPSIRVDVDLSDSTARRLDGVQFFLWEQSDFGEPTAQWFDDGRVSVKGLELRHGLTVTLSPNQWSE
jgi:hypothetical protein